MNVLNTNPGGKIGTGIGKRKEKERSESVSPKFVIAGFLGIAVGDERTNEA